jgi:NitT/TauT family transport system substrate-binding protein
MLVARPYGSEEQARAALLAGEVDVVLTDWLWVARTRAAGADVACLPEGRTAAAVIVPAQGPVTALADLVDRRIGVSGDSGRAAWAMVRGMALAASRLNLDLSARSFGPGPTLAAQLRGGILDAVVADWPDSALLEAGGFRRLISTDDIARGLDLATPLPGPVWAFRDAGMVLKPNTLTGFLEAARAAANRLATDAAAWDQLPDLYPGAGPATRARLRAAYASGRIAHWGAADAGRVDEALRRLNRLGIPGVPPRLPRGMFRDDLAF